MGYETLQILNILNIKNFNNLLNIFFWNIYVFRCFKDTVPKNDDAVAVWK